MCTEFKAGDKVVCVESRNPSVTVGKQYDVKIGSRGRLIFENDNGSPYFIESKSVDKGFEFKKVEKMEEFKAGDLVYRVIDREKVKLDTLFRANPYISLCSDDDTTYLDDGRQGEYDGIPSIFHATPENRQALVTLYGEGAVPTLPLRGSDLTIKLLESKEVLAMVGDDGDENTTPADIRLVTEYRDGEFVTYSGQTFKNAVSVDNQGNEITELPESCDDKA